MALQFNRREVLTAMLCAPIAGLGAVEDPFHLPDVNVPGFPIFKDRTGRTPVYPGLVPGEATDIWLLWGQSLAAFHEITAYSPANPLKLHNIDPYSGGMLLYEAPGLGCTHVAINGAAGENWSRRFGDKRIAAGKGARQIFLPIAVAGSNIAQWATGGIHNERIKVACARLASLGLLSHLTGILSHIGEADNSLGTSQSVFAAAMADAHQTFRNEGATAPILDALSTTQNDGSTSAAVRAAVLSLVGSNNVFAGPDNDSLSGPTNRDASGSHLTATGSNNNATLWGSSCNSAGV